MDQKTKLFAQELVRNIILSSKSIPPSKKVRLMAFVINHRLNVVNDILQKPISFFFKIQNFGKNSAIDLLNAVIQRAEEVGIDLQINWTIGENIIE